MAAKANKLLGLEAIRFLSAFAVLLWHYQHFSFIGDKPQNFVKELQPFYRPFKLFYDYGHYGVRVFWCISGFIFFYKYGELVSKNLISAKKFFIFRFSRLYPLHLITLLLVLTLQIIFRRLNGFYFVYENNTWKYFFLQLLMSSNWGPGEIYSFNGPVWSVSLEVLIYFIFFVHLRFLGKSIWINLCVIGLSLCAKFLKIDHFIFDGMLFFYLGGISSVVFLSIEDKPKRILNFLSWLLVLTLPILTIHFRLYTYPYFSTFFLMLYLPFLLYAMAYDFPIEGKGRKTIEAAGNMTYSSYLIHFPIQLAIVTSFSFFRVPIPYYSPLFWSAFIGLTFVSSFLLYYGFEAPLQTKIRKLVAHR